MQAEKVEHTFLLPKIWLSTSCTRQLASDPAIIDGIALLIHPQTDLQETYVELRKGVS